MWLWVINLAHTFLDEDYRIVDLMLFSFCVLVFVFVQEHQENLLGGTMQNAMALLSNLTAHSDTDLQPLYQLGNALLSLSPLLPFSSLVPFFLLCSLLDRKSVA